MIQLYNGDCLTEILKVPAESVDMVFSDLPYGTTACEWDNIISLDDMWRELNRVCKLSAPMLFTASQPFTSKLVCSNIKNFKCEWIYKKRCASNFAQAKYMPMKEHESVLVFCRTRSPFYPIKETRVGGGERTSKI